MAEILNQEHLDLWNQLDEATQKDYDENPLSEEDKLEWERLDKKYSFWFHQDGPGYQKIQVKLSINKPEVGLTGELPLLKAGDPSYYGQKIIDVYPQTKKQKLFGIQTVITSLPRGVRSLRDLEPRGRVN